MELGCLFLPTVATRRTSSRPRRSATGPDIPRELAAVAAAASS